MLYEHGNKCGRLLARTIQAAKTLSTIHHIRDKQGKLFSRNEDIAKQFETFYSKLYNLSHDHPDLSTPHSCTTQLQNFIAQFCPNLITTQQAEDLESPLSAEEINLAINQMKVWKSPGPDVLPLQYYKSFLDVLSPRMLTAFNTLAHPQTSPGRMLPHPKRKVSFFP